MNTSRFKSFAKFQVDNEAISFPWLIFLFHSPLWAFMMNFSSLRLTRCIWTIVILRELAQMCLICLWRNVFVTSSASRWSCLYFGIIFNSDFDPCLKRDIGQLTQTEAFYCSCLFLWTYITLWLGERNWKEKKNGKLSLKIVFVLELMSCNFHVLSKSWKVSVMGGEMFGWWCECFWTLKLFLL